MTSTLSMPENSASSKKPSAALLTIIIIALVFVIGLFIYMSVINKPELQPQSQPDSEATNSADFNQADRLEATGASLVVSDQPQVTIFARTTCSHCKTVDTFLQKNSQFQNQVTKKFLDDMINGSVYTQEFIQAAKDCGLDENTIGVPFLYFGANSTRASQNRCLMGDTPIISYFENQSN